MPRSHPDYTQGSVIDRVVAHLNQQLGKDQAKLVEAFTRRFYGSVALEDLDERSVIDLAGAILSQWNSLYQHETGTSSVRIYNPHYEQHGWQSTHTVVEVVHDDMPFIVDSLTMEINRLGYTIHLIIHMGAFQFERDKQNRIIDVLPFESVQKGPTPEAAIYFEIDRETDPEALALLQENIERVLDDVTMVVTDWKPMNARVGECLASLESTPSPIDVDDVKESLDFLNWLVSNHFTFLGCRDYVCTGEGDSMALEIVPDSGLGVLQDCSTSKTSRKFSELTNEAMQLMLAPQVLIIAKTNTISTVHRPVYTDYIGVKQYNADGELVGERRFIGLFTSTVYNSNPIHIPFLRRKVTQILGMSNLSRDGHAGKALANIIETLPRDDLFQSDVSELFDLCMGIVHLQERQRIRLFARRDIYGRFMSCLVYVPREVFNTQFRRQIQAMLTRVFHATESTFSTHFSESVLARIHFMFRLDPQSKPSYDLDEVEAKLVDLGRTWPDELRSNLIEYYGEERGNVLFHRYGKGFPAGYRESFLARTAVYDIEHMEDLSDEKPLCMSFARVLSDSDATLHLKFYRPIDTLPLSDVMPILENMGLRVIGEQPYEIESSDGKFCWINDFSLVHQGLDQFDVDKIQEVFREALSKIWFGHAEDDGFNRLVLAAELNWRKISVLRAYSKYLWQIGFTFSQNYIEDAFFENPKLARAIIDLFMLRFSPEKDPDEAVKLAQLEANIEQNLDAVKSLDQDRIIRRYIDVIKATLRTNYFQPLDSGQLKSYISFKLNPEAIPELPLPRPEFEIFVYSTRFEAVHLRSGNVARGGLRWSDRREDFRTEILGLMKAQQVKNAVIVPSGAKGGFVPKLLPFDSGREAVMKEGTTCYQNFIRGMLDITDNLVKDKIVKPKSVRCYDKDDPYLVVAADKGTATFSDVANAISAEYNFWLGDAFASGGSVGYDHKKMGITARGAWESVKRHFWELGHDTQTQDFTVVGIGDMSGDVFGNGMLLSRHIKLVAAFNHMHIFVDPDPDPENSFKERERLFNLPRSTWEDYEEKLISSGGGVFNRAAKSIRISPQMQKMLDTDKDFMVPNDLIQIILKAQVDLLWNGGIGTYVKASDESNVDVGDRANDAIRLNGGDLRARVVGEGGNLGFTQLGRVEYSLKKGKIYSDFIDNSAGVDCSDHEVNIKILLNDIVENGDMTEKQRNVLLASMQDEVSHLVLKNNHSQTRAISLAAAQSPGNVDLLMRYMHELEKQGRLNRELEFLPTDKQIAERKIHRKGFTAPEISVLLAYSKNTIKEDLLSSQAPEDPFLQKYLVCAFPQVLCDQYREQLNHHKLRREIIATQLSSTMINEMGITFVNRLYDETGAPVSAVARAYVCCCEIYQMDEIIKEIEARAFGLTMEVKSKMLLELIRLMRRSTRWFLRNRRTGLNIDEMVERFKPHITQFYEEFPKLLGRRDRDKLTKLREYFVRSGVSESVAVKIASCSAMVSAFDIIEAGMDNNFNVLELANAYYAIGERLKLSWFRNQISSLSVDSNWDALARAALRDDLDWQQRALSIGVMNFKYDTDKFDELLKAWQKQHHRLVERWQSMLNELRSSTSPEFIMYSVALRELLDLAQTTVHSPLARRKAKE